MWFATAARRATLLVLVLTVSWTWPAAATAAPAGGPAPSNTCFIIRVFHDQLGRQPASAEINTWLDFLTINQRINLALVLLASNENRSVFIQGVYHAYLGRSATAGEVQAGQLLLGAGPDENVVSTVLGSSEYFNRPGVGADNANFVQALYHALLGRAATGLEVSAGISFIQGNSRAQLAAIVLVSTEHRAVLIQGWYQKYLGRAAAAGEITAAQTVLTSNPDEDEIALIIGSVEYFNRAGLCAVYLPLARR